ncbi:RDD family protein [Microterricola pindariensis]|uniref:RDD family protein n=1 Tax=Microterricola pindariensis TaxID=478010 RepID=UPI001E6567B0|nr:RDD family protein [Microterricola pindariensis]
MAMPSEPHAAIFRAADAPGSDPRHEPGSVFTGEAVALDVRPASVLLRAGGAMIDAIVYLGALAGLAWLVAAAVGDGLDQSLSAALTIIGLVTALVIAPTVVETASGGRSLGKLAIGARVVRDDGGAIALRHAFIRALTGVLEIYMTLGGLAVIVGMLNPDGKRLGDLLAGTHAQMERVPGYSAPTYGVPVPLQAWAQVADVATLPDRLQRRIAQFLTQAPQLSPAARARLAGQLAQEAARYVSPLPQVEPELFLAGVAAIRRQRDAAALELTAARLERLSPVLHGRPHGFPER